MIIPEEKEIEDKIIYTEENLQQNTDIVNQDNEQDEIKDDKNDDKNS